MSSANNQENQLKNKNEIASDIICEFLEVITHQILYLWRVYPVESFKRVKKYHVNGFENIHSGVSKYIQDIISSIKVLLIQNSVKQFIIHVKDKDEVKDKIVIEIINIDVNNFSADPFFVDLEQCLRRMMLKLHERSKLIDMADNSGADASFEVLAKVCSHQAVDLIYQSSEDVAWVKKQPYTYSEIPEIIIPISSDVNTTFVQMQLSVVKNPTQVD